jgi:hypothetical protein
VSQIVFGPIGTNTFATYARGDGVTIWRYQGSEETEVKLDTTPSIEITEIQGERGATDMTSEHPLEKVNRANWLSLKIPR